MLYINLSAFIICKNGQSLLFEKKLSENVARGVLYFTQQKLYLSMAIIIRHWLIIVSVVKGYLTWDYSPSIY